MKRFRWLLGAAAAAILFWGCSNSAVQEGWVLTNPKSGFTVVSPIVFMTGAGCQSSGASPKIGAIVVNRPDSGYDQFDCHAISKDSIRSLTATYRHLITEAKLRGEAVQSLSGAAGYWQIVDIQKVCTDSPLEGGMAGDGRYRLPDIGVTSNCQWVRTYAFFWYDTIDPGAWYLANPDDGAGGPLSQPPPKTTLNVYLSYITIDQQGTSIPVDGVANFTATAHYSDGSTGPESSVSWESLTPSVAAWNDGNGFWGYAPGTATIRATDDITSLTATVSLNVSAVCGTANDPDLAQIDAGEDPSGNCSPSSADIAAHPECNASSNPIKCVALKVLAANAGAAGCTYNQLLRQFTLISDYSCTGFLNKFLAGDTSTVHLGVATFNAIVADTTGHTSEPALTTRNPANGVSYSSARVYHYASGPANAFSYVLGSFTVYYDANGNAVSVYDFYDFDVKSGDNAVTVTMKRLLTGAASNAGYKVSYP